MKAPIITHTERVALLKQYSTAQVRADIARDAIAPVRLNPAVPHEVPVTFLPRTQQPWPATTRRRLSELVYNLAKLGYYADSR